MKGKAVEGSDKYRSQQITLVLPKLLLMEWIPIGINSLLQLSSQLGVLERCQVIILPVQCAPRCDCNAVLSATSSPF